MEDNQQDQEKTEEPSAKRLLDARKKGQVPRSRDLNMTGATLGGGALLVFSLDRIYQSISEVFHTSFTINNHAMLNDYHILEVIFTTFSEALDGLAIFFIALLLITISGPTLLGGWSFSLQAMKFDMGKLNPLKGFKRMFGINGLVELTKSILKVVLICTIAYFYFQTQKQDLLQLGSVGYELAIHHSISMTITAFIILALGLILIIGIDIPYQIWNHKKQLKMSMQELKDEFKETEGNPESKARLRNMQRELAQRKMLQEVPEADVVIVNPTHFSVALKYDTSSDAAPILVAKGVDHMALKIREIAAEHKVPVFTAPLLSRALFYAIELEEEVPSALYVAVAKVLAYVFQLNNAKPGRYPKPPTDLIIPEEYRVY